MMKKIFFLAALLLLLTTASGCRSRTSAAPRASGAQPQAASSDSGTAADGQPEALTENGGETVENPLAERAEYDEAARAELLENQSRAVSGEGEGGGLLINQGQHILDMWQWLFGMPKALRADISWGKYNDFSVDDEVCLTMKYADKRQATLFMTTGEPGKKERLTVVGNRGRIDLEGNKLTLLKYGTDSLEYGKTAKVRGDGEMQMETICKTYSKEYPDAHREMIQEFAWAVLGKEELSVAGTDGIRTLELTNAAYLSAWEGKWVSLPVDRALYDRKRKEMELREEKTR